jgi:hypothetical protein
MTIRNDEALREGGAVEARELTDLLRTAAEIVERAELSPELKGAAFPHVLEVLTHDPSSGKRPTNNPPMAPAIDVASARAGSVATIATALSLDAETLEAIYALNEGELEVIISSRKIAANRSEGTKELALLLVTGRQLGGWDQEGTSVELIRELARSYNTYQSNHFAETLKEMDDSIALVGPARSRRAKLLRPGHEAAKELIEKLAGESS